MLIKTHKLTGRALNWVVAKLQNVEIGEDNVPIWFEGDDIGGAPSAYTPSTDGAQGEPIIEREYIQTAQAEQTGTWCANQMGSGRGWITGPTRLIAAMRCYVRSKLGNMVYVPDDVLALDA